MSPLQEELATSDIVDAWCKLDHAHAFLAADHDVIDTTRPFRELVVESLLQEPGSIGRDFIHACGALGRTLAEQNASPTLAAASVDTLLAAEDALRPHGKARPPAFSIAARAALFESYVYAMTAAHRDEARHGWEYPACVVPVQDGVVGIAAGHPADDAEALAGWASRVAHAVALAGVRRAVVAGSEPAVRAVADAFEVAGIELLERVPGAPARTRAALR